MKTFAFLFVTMFAVFLFAGCNGTAVQEPAKDDTAKNGETEKDNAEEIKSALTEIETKAQEAWKNKDGEYFEGMLSDNFVSNGGPATKADLVKMISGHECDVKDVKMSDGNVAKLDDSVMLFTSKVDSDYTCDDRKGITSGYAASVYVKEGDDWKGAFHQSLPANDAEGETQKVPVGDAESADDELTKSLAATEDKLWEAWSKKDAKTFEDAATAGYVGLDGDGRSDKAKLLKSIAESKCEVRSFSTKSHKTTKLSDNVVLLTYVGNQDATCDGNAIPAAVFASTVYIKDGDAWKFAFHIETPVVQ